VAIEETHMPIDWCGDIVAAPQKGREPATQVGFSGSDLPIIATAISELARNIVVYAKRGDGLGVRDIAMLRHGALDAAIASEPAVVRSAEIAKAAEFFAEILSPFEMSLSGG
jgi:hypothetical protein